MTNVVRLDGTPDHRAGLVQESVVLVLEELLEAAREGRVQAIAVTWLDENDRGARCYGGFTSSYNLLGALQLLQHDIVDEIARSGG
jgi:hypothetical protein